MSALILENAVSDSVANMTDIWKNSVFKELAHAKPDITGKFGERLLNDLLKKYGFLVKWDEDKNTASSDGTYDLKVNEERIEVKTSFENKNGGWQHENIYKERVWDKLALVDVEPYAIFITILNFEEMTFDTPHPVFNRTPSLRDNHKSGCKFDLGKCNVKNGVKAGITYRWDLSDEKGLREFLTKKFS
jgi:hypothetical protein